MPASPTSECVASIRSACGSFQLRLVLRVALPITLQGLSTSSPAAADSYRKQIDGEYQRMMPVRGGLGQVSELPPDLSKLWKIPSASGYGPFVLTRLNRLLTMPPHGTIDDSWREQVIKVWICLACDTYFCPRMNPKHLQRLMNVDSTGQFAISATRLARAVRLQRRYLQRSYYRSQSGYQDRNRWYARVFCRRAKRRRVRAINY